MSVIDSIKEAKNKGASDDQIIEEIVNQNPSRAETFKAARNVGADSTAILNEIITQNTPSTLNRVSVGVGKFLGETTGITGIGEALKESISRPLTTRELVQVSGKAAGSAAKLGLTLASLGVSLPASVLGRLGLGTALGAGFGGSEALEEGKDLAGIAKSTAVGAGVGLATGGVFEGARWAVKGVPKLISYTSGTPEKVLQRNFDDPKAMVLAGKEVKNLGPEGIRKITQDAVRQLRTNLSEQYDEGAKVLIAQNTGQRINLGKYQEMLKMVQKQFGIDLPQNLNNLSIKEGLALNKEINGLYSKQAIREGERGVIVRKLKDLFAKDLRKFTGVKEFLGNYATESKVFDAADELVKAYRTNSPKSQRTALSALRNAFNENNSSYLSALKDLEDATGFKLLDKIATLSTQKVAPRGSFGTSLLRDLIFPLTSPSVSAKIVRTLGRVSRAPQTTRGLTRKFLGQVGSQQVSSIIP